MGKNKNKKHFLKLYEKNDDRYIYYYVRFHDNGEVAFIIEDHDDTFMEFFDGPSVEYRIVKLTSIESHLLFDRFLGKDPSRDRKEAIPLLVDELVTFMKWCCLESVLKEIGLERTAVKA
jgi:hypothetical protein